MQSLRPERTLFTEDLIFFSENPVAKIKGNNNWKEGCSRVTLKTQPNLVISDSRQTDRDSQVKKGTFDRETVKLSLDLRLLPTKKYPHDFGFWGDISTLKMAWGSNESASEGILKVHQGSYKSAPGVQ